MCVTNHTSGITLIGLDDAAWIQLTHTYTMGQTTNFCLTLRVFHMNVFKKIDCIYCPK